MIVVVCFRWLRGLPPTPHPLLAASIQLMATSQHQVAPPVWSITTAQGARSSQLLGGGCPSLRSSLGAGAWWGAAAAGTIRSLLPEVAQPWGECAGTTYSPTGAPFAVAEPCRTPAEI